MVMNRIRLCLTAIVMSLALAGTATAQDFQFFAPADLSEYGEGIQAKEGFFFTFDLLQWTITAPDSVRTLRGTMSGRVASSSMKPVR
jgi:hypothetical protein